LEGFLEGLPKRYLRTHAVEDVLAHMNMANALAKDPVQVALKRGRHWFDLSVVTSDRAFLFANMTGVLAAWGMNIVKATAFSNHAGVVVDTFYFTDQFRVLELNLPEWERFKQSVHDVITGKADFRRCLFAAQHADRGGHPGPSRTAASHQFEILRTQLQHRHCADRNRGPDRDRRVLSHFRRRETHHRTTSARSRGAALRARRQVAQKKAPAMKPEFFSISGLWKGASYGRVFALCFLS
jgi:hypothetical protein